MSLTMLLYLGGCFGKLPSGGDEQDQDDSGVTDSGDTADTGDTAPEDTGTVEPGEELDVTVSYMSDEGLFGWALDEGDVDGDLRDDLLVGVPGMERGEAHSSAMSGRAYLISGPLFTGVGDWSPSVTFVGIAAGDAVGTALTHGDFNHDGVNDVAISGGVATGDNPNASGFVSVVDGPFVGDVALSRGTLLEQNGVDDAFGASLLVGDFTSDGVDDLAVSVPQGDVGEWTEDAGRGVVYVYGGSDGGLANGNIGVAMVGDTEGGHFGEAFAMGDANGDGVDDLLVGAPHADNGTELNTGAAYLFLGPLNETVVTSDAEISFYGDETGDEMGASVDFDDIIADGLSDLMIGSPGNDDNGLNTGAVDVFYSSAWLHCAYLGEQPGSRAGSSVEFANDMNGDGFSDLVVGAPEYDEGGVADIVDAGRAYLVLGPLNGVYYELAGSDHVTGDAADMRLGLSVLGDTDLTGDSLADIVFGAPSTSDTMDGNFKILAGY